MRVSLALPVANQITGNHLQNTKAERCGVGVNAGKTARATKALPNDWQMRHVSFFEGTDDFLETSYLD